MYAFLLEKMKPKNTDQETEDRKPSIDDLLARSHKRKRKKARKEADDPNENNNHTEPPAEATVNRPSKWTDQLVEVAKTSFRGFIITIYAEADHESLSNGNRRFYFEPLVLLDPSSIVSESHVLLKKDFVRFSVQMWTADLRSKVHSTLMSLNHADVREENVHVMPYEEVQLKLNCSLLSFMLMKEPTFYSRMNENLDFYFLCDSPETAVTLAQDFRQNPEFSLKSFRLQMECKGLTLRNPVLERPYFVFNVSSLPRGI